MEKKLACSEQAREELEKQTELLRQVLEDKEKEIRDARDQLRQAKEVAIREYRDSDALLVELGTSFAEGFDDALCQVKTSYPDLNVSHVTIKVHDQLTTQPVLLESTEDLFADDATVDLQGDRGATTEGQLKTVKEGTRHLEDVQTVEEKDNAPAVQQQILFLFYVRFWRTVNFNFNRCPLYLNLSLYGFLTIFDYLFCIIRLLFVR